MPAHGFWRGAERSLHITHLELLAVHRALSQFEARLRGRSTLLWVDNSAVVHILTNRTTRSPEMMALLRRVWWLIDSAGIDLRVKWISTHENNFADALSRGAPLDELLTGRECWRQLQARHGPHTFDRYATPANALLPRFNTAAPHPLSSGAPALAQAWEHENNYAFPPIGEIPALVQFLCARPAVQATLLVPYWPAQAWFQQLTERADRIEVWAASQALRVPSLLHGSAQHVLSGMHVALARVASQAGR